LGRLLRALAAVLAGNALYFLLLGPRLPGWARHKPFALDAGLIFDFVICVALYFALGPLVRPGRHSG
jgi:hypothetical protein